MGRKLSTANVSYPFSPETRLFLSRFKIKVAVVTEMEVIDGLNHENLLPRQIDLIICMDDDLFNLSCNIVYVDCFQFCLVESLFPNRE